MYGCQWNWFPLSIDDVTADKSRRMNSEVFGDILSAHIQPNAPELIGCRFTEQMDKDPKPKQPKSFLRQSSVMFCDGQVHHLT